MAKSSRAYQSISLVKVSNSRKAELHGICFSSFLFASQVTQQFNSSQKHAYGSTVLLASWPLARQCLGQCLVSIGQNSCRFMVVWLCLCQLKAQGAKQNLQKSMQSYRPYTDSIESLPIHSTCTKRTRFGDVLLSNVGFLHPNRCHHCLPMLSSVG